MSERRRTWGFVIVAAILCGVVAGQSAPPAEPADDGGASGERVIDPDSMQAIVGVTQAVPHDANPMVASVAEALQKGNHHERLSEMIVPAKFDEKAYAADSESYLNTVEPGRIWQPAQPREGIPQAQAASPEYVEALQGEAVVLKVQVIPQAPVTFTSFDLGAFSNRLTSITVAADEKGIAIAPFTGTPGTYNEVNILAASPLTSGQVRFTVFVVVPKLRERHAEMLGK